MSTLDTIFSRELTVNLSENIFYRHKTSSKLEEMLKNVPANF